MFSRSKCISQFKDYVVDFSKGVTETHLIEKIEAIYSVEKYKRVKEQHEKYIDGINWDFFEIFEK